MVNGSFWKSGNGQFNPPLPAGPPPVPPALETPIKHVQDWNNGYKRDGPVLRPAAQVKQQKLSPHDLEKINSPWEPGPNPKYTVYERKQMEKKAQADLVDPPLDPAKHQGPKTVVLAGVTFHTTNLIARLNKLNDCEGQIKYNKKLLEDQDGDIRLVLEAKRTEEMKTQKYQDASQRKDVLLRQADEKLAKTIIELEQKAEEKLKNTTLELEKKAELFQKEHQRIQTLLQSLPSQEDYDTLKEENEILRDLAVPMDPTLPAGAKPCCKATAKAVKVSIMKEIMNSIEDRKVDIK